MYVDLMWGLRVEMVAIPLQKSLSSATTRVCSGLKSSTAVLVSVLST